MNWNLKRLEYYFFKKRYLSLFHVNNRTLQTPCYLWPYFLCSGSTLIFSMPRMNGVFKNIISNMGIPGTEWRITTVLLVVWPFQLSALYQTLTALFRIVRYIRPGFFSLSPHSHSCPFYRLVTHERALKINVLFLVLWILCPGCIQEFLIM